MPRLKPKELNEALYNQPVELTDKPNSNPHFYIDLGTDGLGSAKKEKLFNTLELLVLDFISSYRELLLSEIDEYQKCNPNTTIFTDAIKDHIKFFGLEKPYIGIYGTESGNQFLIKNQLQRQLGPDSLMLVFQQSKPLSWFWKKGNDGNKSPEDESRDLNRTVIEWGTLYRKVMPELWKLIYRLQEQYNINLSRINLFSDHNNEYYYVWEVSAKSE